MVVRDYKSFSGKINTYALRAQAMPRHYALKVLEETHQHWKNLHFVKKRHVIGETNTQQAGHAAPVKTDSTSSASTGVSLFGAGGGSALSVSTITSPKPIMAGSASPKLIHAGGGSPKLLAAQGRQISAPAMGELIPAAQQPQAMPQGVGDLTGVEQPMDKLFAGRK